MIELRGDEALAVFESPREALRAAVELQLTFADEMAFDPTLPLRVGIGLDAGEAVPVDGGYRGGALNLAARLCSQARAGEVWVSQGVAHIARAVPELRLHEHGEVEVKGLADAVRVFRAAPVDDHPDALAARLASTAEGVPTAPSELPAALDAVTPIVGRDAEIRRLRWLWRCARRGAGGAAVIGGPAGIGKTRLAAEVAGTAAKSGAHVAYVSYAEAHDGSLPSTAELPALIVLDDLESASAPEFDDARRALAECHGAHALILAAYDYERASAELLNGLTKLGDRLEVVRPQPLDADAVRQIASFYLGGDAEVPSELLAESGGVPRRIHEHLAEWAHKRAAQRLGTFASTAATRRSDLRSIEAELASSVVDLQLVREQVRLFASRGAEVAAPPYKGLASFDVDDAEWFFGRERLVADLVARLAGSALLGVVGPSGSGKSSAVRAGLVPALQAGVLPGSASWSTLIMRPSDHPLRELDRTLWSGLPEHLTRALEGSDAPLRDVRNVLREDEHIVLVVDQFEEVFTVCRDKSERKGFIDAISDSAADTRKQVTVVLALRADFYGRCAATPALAEQLGANHVLVHSPSPDEYRRAIEQPALRAGARIEPDLVEALVDEVVGEPGALPLLSTALLELWDRRGGRTITRQTSLTTGRVRGAVARLAEDAYAGLTEEQQAIARAVLLRLAAVGEGDAAVRRRVALSEFDVERSPDVARVVDVLTERRLVTVSDGTVEVAHEALIREWPRFRQWVEEDREGRRLHAHLAATAREWADRDQDPAELYRGARLSAALDWTTEHTLELNELEREFVNASRVENERELVEQRRRNRRLLLLLAGTGVLLALSVVTGVVALAQRASAKRAARVALARQLGAQAVSEPRIDRAMLLAREAVKLEDSRQTEGRLLATLLRSPTAIATFSSPITDRPQTITLSPDGKTLAAVENTDVTRFYDTRTRRETHALPNTIHIAPAYARDGNLIVLMRRPGPTKPPAIDVRDGHTLRHLRYLPLGKRWLSTPTSFANPLFVSPDNRTAYMAYSLVDPNTQSDGAAYVDRWDIRTGKLLGSVALGSNGMYGGRIEPDGTLRVLTDTELLTLEDRTLRRLRATRVDLPGTSFSDIAHVSTGGRSIAVARPSGSVSFVDVSSGRATIGAGRTGSAVQAVAFSPRGDAAVTTNENGQVTIWDPQTSDVKATFAGHENRTLGIAFSGDGSTFFTCSLDGAIHQWDLGGRRRFGRPFEVRGAAALTQVPNVPLLPPLALAPDGSRFAARIGTSTVGVFSMRTLRPLRSFAVKIGGPIGTIAWSPVGGELALSGPAGRVQLWSIGAQPHLVRTLELRPVNKLPETVNAMEFSPGGNLLAAVASNQVPGPNPPVGLAAVWNTASGTLLWRHVHRQGSGDALAFSRDGTLLALSFQVGPSGGVDQLVDPTSGRVQRTLRPIGGFTQSFAFAPGGTLATGGWSGIVQLWNVENGRHLGHPVLTLPAPVATISFDPSGEVFVTGSSSGFEKLWDTKTLQQLGAPFPGSPGKWGNAQFTRDGSKLVTLYQDGQGTVWPATLRAWQEHACRVAGRNLHARGVGRLRDWTFLP